MNQNDPHDLRPLLERALAGDVQAWNDFFAAIRHYLHAELRRVSKPDVAHLLDHSALVQSTLRRVGSASKLNSPTVSKSRRLAASWRGSKRSSSIAGAKSCGNSSGGGQPQPAPTSAPFPACAPSRGNVSGWPSC
jgi:hypothetical protein